LQNNGDGSAVLYDLAEHTTTDLPSPIPGNYPDFVGTPAYALSYHSAALTRNPDRFL